MEFSPLKKFLICKWLDLVFDPEIDKFKYENRRKVGGGGGPRGGCFHLEPHPRGFFHPKSWKLCSCRCCVLGPSASGENQLMDRSKVHFGVVHRKRHVSAVQRFVASWADQWRFVSRCVSCVMQMRCPWPCWTPISLKLPHSWRRSPLHRPDRRSSRLHHPHRSSPIE